MADLIAYLIFLGFIFCVVFVNDGEYHSNRQIQGVMNALANDEVG